MKSSPSRRDRRRQASNKMQTLIWQHGLLMLACILVVAFWMFNRQKASESLMSHRIVDYIVKSGLEQHAFTVSDKNSFVPDLELYAPLPAKTALLTEPREFLQAIRRYELTCRPRDLTAADKIARELSLKPSKLLDWQVAVCQKQPDKFLIWLERTPYLHPSGVSYAQLFRETFKVPGPENLPHFLHVSERSDPSDFDRWYRSLSIDEQTAFSHDFDLLPLGSQLALSPDWDGKTRRIYVYSLEQINSYISQYEGFEIGGLMTSPACEISLNQICFFTKGSWWHTWTLAKLYILFFGIGLYGVGHVFLMYLRARRFRRDRESDQALLFQLISHEIRTPMTVINLNLDGLRRNFDRLEESAQKNFMQILDGFHELEKIVNRSLRELKGERQSSVFDIVAASEKFIEAKAFEKLSVEAASEPIMVLGNDFWFEVCLSNLIRNALFHGRPPVQVRFKKDSHWAYVEVQDQGVTPLKTLRAGLRPFQKGEASKGLGLGLSIVERNMESMGGRLLIASEPTRFTLQVPLALVDKDKHETHTPS